jgi:gliding motility-associated-like protein
VNVNSCTNTAVASITVNPLPVLTASASANVICNGESVTLSGFGAATYTWSGNVTNGVAFTPSVTSGYTLNGTSAAGCSSATSAVVSVTVLSLPAVNAGISNSVICAGDSVKVNANGAVTYTWTSGLSNNTFFTPLANSSYTVTGTGGNGCKNFAVTEVTVNSLPDLKITPSESLACAGETITLTASGAATYTWSNMTNGSSIVINPGAPSSYTVVATSSEGCRGKAVHSQSVLPCLANILANANVSNVTCFGKNDGSISIGTSVTYTNNSIRYLWNSDELCPSKNCAAVNRLKAGTYSVTVLVTYTINANNVRTDTVAVPSIIIRDEKGPCNITVFSGVSPNGDGVNDVFAIENIDQYPENHVTIFNRWGAEVGNIRGYDNISKAWPSAGDLGKTSSSTYYYVIDLGDGSPLIKGWIELIRN